MRFRILILAGLLLTGASLSARAAEFDVNGPSLEMRQIQFCQGCRSSLIVTTVPPGTKIQCPQCQTAQRRMPSEKLLIRVYQVCPACGARMDVRDYKPGELIRCGTCSHVQPVLREAVDRPEWRGDGEPPEAPVVRPIVTPPQTTTPAAPAIPAPSRDERRVLAAAPLETPSPPIPVPAPIASAPQPRRESDAPTVAPGIPGLSMDPAAYGNDKKAVPAALDVTVPGIFSDTRALQLRGAVLGESAAATEPPADAVQLEDFGGWPKEPPPEPRQSVQIAPPEPPEPQAVGQVEPDPFARAEPDLDEPRLAARVNARPITQAAVERVVQQALDMTRIQLGARANTPQGQAFLANRKIELQQESLQTLIDRELIVDAAERAGLEPDREAVLREAETLRTQSPDAQAAIDEARTRLIIRAVMEQHQQQPAHIRPAAIKEFYEAHTREFLQPRRVRVRVLTVYYDRAGKSDSRSADAIAREIMTALRQHAGFRDLIARYSEGPAREQLGELSMNGEPWLPVSHLGEPVQTALETLPVGKIFGPLALSNAYLFLELIDHKSAEPVSLREVSGLIQKRLEAKAADRSFQKWLGDLRKQARIETF